ncbi:MAG: DUF5615 family PIN-like protein [Chloroflexi bacterium]|nr:DUF5615 family PIN-like protein [Chloroflexota bacterium]
MSGAVLAGLRRLGIDAESVQAHARLGLSDEAQLRYSTESGRCFVTFNRADFLRLHAAFLRSAETHGGIVIGIQQSLGIGETIRRLERLARTLDGRDIANRVEFLSDWGDPGA